VSRFVIGDDEGPEFAFTPVVALPRHPSGRLTWCRGGDQRGECGEARQVREMDVRLIAADSPESFPDERRRRF
jgi:hypothetical protein